MVEYLAPPPSKDISQTAGPLSRPLPALPGCTDDVKLRAMLLLSLSRGRPIGRRASRRKKLQKKSPRKKKRYTCKECGYDPKQLSDLKRHINAVHLHRKDFACKECDKRFTQGGHLNTHMKTVHGGPPKFDCPECEAKFTAASSVDRHRERLHDATIEKKGKKRRKPVYVDLKQLQSESDTEFCFIR